MAGDTNSNCHVCDRPDCDFTVRQAAAEAARLAWARDQLDMLDMAARKRSTELRVAANDTHAEMLRARQRCEGRAVDWRARFLALQASHDAGLYASELWCVLSSGYMLSPSIVKLYLSRELADAACALSAAAAPGQTYEVEELQSFMYSQRCTHEDTCGY